MLPAAQFPAPALPAFARVHALDATRGAALLLGVVFHGLESLTATKQYCVAQDTQGSLLVDGAYYVCHVFRMQVFFLLAGYFAHLLYHRRGPRAFAVDRAKRLLVPLVVFWIGSYLLVTALWVWNIHRVSGLPLPQAFARLPANFRFEQGLPLMHLWFLYFLLLFCGGVVLIRPLVARWLDASLRCRAGADQLLASIMRQWWGSLGLACLMVGPMLGMTDWFGVDTPGSSLWPRWAPFSLYGLYFTLGWLLHRQPPLLHHLREFRVVNLVVSGLLVGTLLLLKLRYDARDPAVAGWLLAVMNTLYAFASMAASWAFIGFMLRYFSGPNPLIRYLSDSAYWGYLIHFPVVIFFQILVAPYFWHWSIKLLLILGPTFLVMLLTYQVAVRNTWLGLLLKGRVYQDRAPSAVERLPLAAEARR